MRRYACNPAVNRSQFSMIRIPHAPRRVEASALAPNFRCGLANTVPESYDQRIGQLSNGENPLPPSRCGAFLTEKA